MSSFRRKGSVKQSPVYPGTRPSPATPSTLITSTGIPSLDDILGGGLPLSCSLLVAAPDLHSSYGDLVQKYFIAQGLSCRHRLCVIDDNAEAFVKDIMWIPRARTGAVPELTVDEDEEKPGSQEDQKIKIAWRYEQMKPFQTTVAAPSSDKFSTLRGLSASAGGTGGSGENNLTFKSTRKRLIFETLHLDIEGGVGERRTTPSATVHDAVGDAHDHTDHAGHAHEDQRANKTAFAAIEVALEDSVVQTAAIYGEDKTTDGLEVKPKKQKKKVAFRADRPDLYDF
ncbi:hypothetical protein DXG03_006078 [Asterophora parasitica]|uniref:Elongator complex protein 4 n=1 Tax=Asterophora parasitica TaxID=117018 RepID=A0A9P7GEJ2_9AGAR|nr:hypothetical protein DXG03_006078 [Asterophora parasitica]